MHANGNRRFRPNGARMAYRLFTRPGIRWWRWRNGQAWGGSGWCSRWRELGLPVSRRVEERVWPEADAGKELRQQKGPHPVNAALWLIEFSGDALNGSISEDRCCQKGRRLGIQEAHSRSLAFLALGHKHFGRSFGAVAAGVGHLVGDGVDTAVTCAGALGAQLEVEVVDDDDVIRRVAITQTIVRFAGAYRTSVDRWVGIEVITQRSPSAVTSTYLWLAGHSMLGDNVTFQRRARSHRRHASPTITGIVI